MFPIMSKRSFLTLSLLFFMGMNTALAAPYITAAIHWTNGKVQFFLNDGTYLRYDIHANGVDPGYPKPINENTWPGMGRYAYQISAAFNGPSGRPIFFLATASICVTTSHQIALTRAIPNRLLTATGPA